MDSEAPRGGGKEDGGRLGVLEDRLMEFDDWEKMVKELEHKDLTAGCKSEHLLNRFIVLLYIPCFNCRFWTLVPVWYIINARRICSLMCCRLY